MWGDQSATRPRTTAGELTLVQRQVRAGLSEVLPDLSLLDFGVVDGHVGTLSKEVADETDRRRLASVAGVGLERESENGQVL